MEVDCTPEEARAFLGLPDIKPMQDALITQMQERLSANLRGMDADTLWRTWFPVGLQNMEQLQRLFWSHVAGQAGLSGSTETK